MIVATFALSSTVFAQTPSIQIQADQVAAHVSPTLYGLMTEEINYSYDGGLYAELVRNRAFKENTNSAVHWSVVQDSGAAGSISLDTNQPLNLALPVSLRLDVTQASAPAKVGIANDGYWGIPVRPSTRYRASFYARAAAGFTGPITVAIVDASNATVYASAQVKSITGDWKKYEVTLKTGNVGPSKDSQLQIWTSQPGTVWFNVVSLFPPTYKNRPNGNRPDIMQLLADMHPAFLRFPGGNYLEGNTIATRFNWKETIHDISQRPGHRDDAWRYWSDDGMGLLEYLEWCEDLHMQPVLAVYAGYSLRQIHVNPGPDLEPYVQDALDEIEYVTGGPATTWGRQRIADGHLKPFPLNYIEIGNEDNFDRSHTYGGRYAQFYDAIKAKYPKLMLIATAPITNRVPDMIDDHYYRQAVEFESDATHYDKQDRNGPKIFVGEWATIEGVPTPNMNAALADAAWLTGMERNSDLILISSYAPLFVNVNRGGMQWATDLIGYDTLTSYGSPSYYAQKIFSLDHGDVVLPSQSQNFPTQTWPPRGRRNGEAPPPRQVPTLFYDVTRDTRAGAIYLKLVNVSSNAQPVHITVKGMNAVAAKGQSTVLCADSPTATNSITEPVKIVPVVTTLNDLSADMTRNLPPYSITILQLAAK